MLDFTRHGTRLISEIASLGLVLDLGLLHVISFRAFFSLPFLFVLSVVCLFFSRLHFAFVSPLFLFSSFPVQEFPLDTVSVLLTSGTSLCSDHGLIRGGSATLRL